MEVSARSSGKDKTVETTTWVIGSIENGRDDGGLMEGSTRRDTVQLILKK